MTQAPQDQTPPDNSHETPPPPKKKYEKTKDHIFLSSPIYPHKLPSKPSLSQTSMNISSHYSHITNSPLKHNSLLFICIQLNTPFDSMTKIKTSSSPFHLKICLPSSIGLTMM